MKKCLLLAAAAFCAVSLVFARGSKQADEGDKIAIGAVLTISGLNGFYGTESRDGALLAVDDLNASGGVLGKKVELIVEDDARDPAQAASAFAKLSAQDKVSYIVGASLSSTTRAFSAQAQAAKIVLISPSATNVAITDPGEYIFRACFVDSFQGVVAANFAYKNLGARKAAVLYDAGADYNAGLAAEFKKSFQNAGGRIAAEETYRSGAEDFDAQIARIKAAAPDVVYLPNYYHDVARQLKQLRAQGVKVPTLGGDGWDSLVGHADDSALNGYWTSVFSKYSTEPKAQDFVREYERRYRKPASSLAALSYDSVMLLADAIKTAGTSDSAAVAKALAALQGNYVTGDIRFDAHRDPIKGAVVNEIVKQDGKLVNAYRATVNPEKPAAAASTSPAEESLAAAQSDLYYAPGQTEALVQAAGGKEWKLAEVRKGASATVLDRAKLAADGTGDLFTIAFAQSASGKAAPNRYYAPYSAGADGSLNISHAPYSAGSDGSLETRQPASTFMAPLAKPLPLSEKEYFLLLVNARTWKVGGDKLEIGTFDAEGKPATLVFVN